jgi:Ca2+/Na+ antiporter
MAIKYTIWIKVYAVLGVLSALLYTYYMYENKKLAKKVLDNTITSNEVQKMADSNDMMSNLILSCVTFFVVVGWLITKQL